jgi:hypothetical protein
MVEAVQEINMDRVGVGFSLILLNLFRVLASRKK